MKIKSLIILVSLLFFGIIIGRFSHSSPKVAISSVESIQPTHKLVDTATISTTDVNTLEKNARITPVITKVDSELKEAEETCIESNEKKEKQVQQAIHNRNEQQKLHHANLKKQEEAKIRQLDTKLFELERYVSEQQEKIESWYANEFERLKLWADGRSRELDAEAKAAYARCLQKMENTESKSVAVYNERTYGYADTYSSPYGNESTDFYAHTEGVMVEETETSVVGDPAEEYKLELKNINESQREIEDVFSDLLETRKKYFAELNSYARTRRAVIEAEKKGVVKNTKVKMAGGPGSIDVICYSKTKPCIMFSGEILYEGDYANGFKIVKIHKNDVEFEKNGQIFVQSP